MLTPEQEKWIESLSDRIISITPYDSRAEEFFKRTKVKIQDLLGPDVAVEHCGATALGISGQDEVDVSIVVEKEKFPEYISKLEVIFGPVRSKYEDRARFEVRDGDKKIDLKIIDVNHPNYINGKVFEDYLRHNPQELERYRALKLECDGLTTREYNRRKVEFTNEILEKAKVEK